MCEMCVTIIYFLLVKLIKFFPLSFYMLLATSYTVNKDFHNHRLKRVKRRRSAVDGHKL